MPCRMKLCRYTSELIINIWVNQGLPHEGTDPEVWGNVKEANFSL